MHSVLSTWLLKQTPLCLNLYLSVYLAYHPSYYVCAIVSSAAVTSHSACRAAVWVQSVPTNFIRAVMQPVSLSVLTSPSGQRRPKKSQHTITYNTASDTMTNTEHDKAKKEGKKERERENSIIPILAITLKLQHRLQKRTSAKPFCLDYNVKLTSTVRILHPGWLSAP